MITRTMDIIAMGSHNYNNGTDVHQVSKLSTGKGKKMQNQILVMKTTSRPQDEPKPQE